jgi:LacI family transcriptional regulator
MHEVPRVLLLLESSRSSGRSLLRGIARYARHHGPWAFYWEARGLEESVTHLRAADADGVILRDVDLVPEVRARKLPAIVVEHTRSGIAGLVNVIVDSESVGRLAADHLLQCGFRHFAFCGFVDKPWSRVRGESFQRILATHGQDVSFFAPAPAATAWKKERVLLSRWLASLPRPVGVLACNDDRADHVIEACKMAGLRVPDEVAVVGVDNDDLVCELSDPPLSSIALNFERAGYESAQALDRLMRGGSAPSNRIIVQATHLVARQSTDVMTIEDPVVAKALRFIRTHAGEVLRVTDIAQAAGASRRALEKRFRTALNRTVLDEIRQTRTDRIARMLTETSLSVARIAEDLGFESAQHVARYFRKFKHLTPLAYRRAHGAL